MATAQAEVRHKIKMSVAHIKADGTVAHYEDGEAEVIVPAGRTLEDVVAELKGMSG